MENLLEPELQKLEGLCMEYDNVRAQYPNGIEDPCKKYCAILEEFVTWYFMARRARHTESSIFEVAERGLKLQVLAIFCVDCFFFSNFLRTVRR